MPIEADIPSEVFIPKKINYIHLNCVRGIWRLAAHWEDNEYSRPRFYVAAQNKWIVPVMLAACLGKEMLAGQILVLLTSKTL